MIVATAGHIDHGKTALVKALTGVDTDRLPEEKARGISIDLGFAYWQPARSPLVGFVDVPGHERFVRNMLAGVCGIDYALLVVAADDGVMPQTREHLQILDLLSVARGAAVITKTDRVDAARVAQVEREVRDLLAPTALAQADVLPVSAVTGAGLERLREVLVAAAAGVRRDTQAGRRLRHAVDRAFTVAGTGTVVTGTVFAGSVAPGDLLTLTPGGQEVRVRGVQMHGRAVASASAGERCALALAGVAVADVQRGDWVVHPALHAPTQRLDVRVRVLDSEPGALRHWTPVHLHLGTREVTGRVAMRRAAAIEPGQWGVAQLVLDQPIAALAHDRFILRDQSAQRTVAGGLVLDPSPARQRVRRETREAQLEALQHPDAERRLRALAAATPAGVDAAAFARAANLDEPAFAGLLRRGELVALGRDDAQVVLPKSTVDAIADAVAAALPRFHREQPQAPGMDLAALRRECAPALSPAGFQDVLRELAQRKLVEMAGALVRRPGHAVRDNPADQRLWHLVQPALREAGLGGIAVPQLAADTRTSEPVLRGLLQRRAQAGELVRVTPDRFYLRGTMAVFAAVASAVAQAAPDGRFAAGAFRDRSGVGRALAVEVLESLDRLGITQRIADVRIVRRDFVPVLGPAEPPPAPARPADRGTKGDTRHVR